MEKRIDAGRGGQRPGASQVRRVRQPAAAAFVAASAALAGVGVIAPAAAQAPAWPAAAIHFIIPQPPGGSVDLISRYVADKLRERLGQPVLAENTAGAGGAVGVARLAKSKPDGYTIGFGNSATHTINPFLSAATTYDPVNDFTHIALINEYVNVLLVSPKSPVRDVKELVELSKKRPGGLSYGSSGIGASNHLTGELLARTTGGRFLHVPYKSVPAALTDLQGGRVDFTFNALESSTGFLADGSLKALATTGRTRHALAPDLPTVGESYPGFVVQGFMGIFAPAGLPRPIAERLNAEIGAIMLSADAKERLAKRGFSPRTSTPAELQQRVKDDGAHWKSLIDAAGIKVSE